MADFDYEFLERIYEDINLGILDKVKDPERWGNLILKESDQCFSVPVIEYARRICEVPAVKEDYLRRSDKAREDLKQLEGLV